jgi:hypothetical protein
LIGELGTKDCTELYAAAYNLHWALLWRARHPEGARNFCSCTMAESLFCYCLITNSNSAESFQAILCAKLHEKDYPDIIKSVAGVVFLGTPHRGSNSQPKASLIATIASAVHCGVQSSLLKAVEKDSEMLADLLQDFTRTANIESIPLFCFFEQYKSDIGKVLTHKGSLWLTYKV